MVPDAPPHVTNSVLEELLSDHRGYLVPKRGLVAGSVHGYDSVARRFLSTKIVVSALGSLLHYLHLEGRTAR